MSNQTQPEPPAGKDPAAAAKQIMIDIPADLKAVYANIAFISHTPAEMVIDFAQILPRTPKGNVQARIIMSPMHTKLLWRALGQNIANFERQFGEIRFPRTLADELFSFSPPNQGRDE